MIAKGTVLGGRYEIIEKIGAGGMAVVYKARCNKLDRLVAIKVLRDEYIEDENFVKKFKAEAMQASKLVHPNIVSIYDVGFEDDLYYIVMEYVKGDTLKKIVNSTKNIDFVKNMEIMIKVAEALNSAHKNGIIHRDIKTQNIIITDDGEVKVADFGIATATTTSTLAVTSNAIGSVHYFSPEQAKGEMVDERSDIYSFGIVMFEMFTRSMPFEGETPVSVAIKHVLEEMPRPSDVEPKVSEKLENIILKCTKKSQKERYNNLTEVIEDLKKEYEYLLKNDIEQKAIDKTMKSVMAEKAPVVPEIIRQEVVEDDEEDIIDEEKAVIDESLPVEDEAQVEEEIDEGDEDVANTPIEEPSDDIDIMHEKITRNESMPREWQSITKQKFLESKGQSKAYDDLPDEISPEYYDKGSDKVVYIGATITALIIISIITLAGLMFVRNFEKSLIIDMPSYVGQDFAEANKDAETKGIVLNKTEKADDSVEGTVLTQSIEEGQKIQKNTNVEVIVSKGLEKSKVPDVIGEQYSVAKKKLESEGFEVGLETVESTEVDGTVLNQDPAAGTTLEKTKEVLLQVAKGKDVLAEDVEVPTVIDISLSSAKKVIADAGLVIGKTTYKASATLAKDMVISQSLKAGTKVKKGTSIDLVLSNSENLKDEFNTTPATTKPTTTTPTTPKPIATTPVAELKKLVLTVKPIQTLSDTNVAVKIIVISGTKSELKYNRVCNVADFPFNFTVEGKVGDMVQVYIDDKVQVEDVIK